MERLKNIELYMFDLDGTVYLGGRLLSGARETLEWLRASGKRLAFVTNNSSVTALDYVKKLNNLGIETDESEVFTSGQATAYFINANFKGKSVYALAPPAVLEEFRQNGLRLVEDEPDICLLAFDKTLTYDKIQRFNHYLKRGAVYIATHPDNTCPYPEVYIPDAGAFIGMFKVSCGRTPDFICGKPYAPLGEMVLEKYGISPKNCAMFGDRLLTDVQFGKNLGALSVLVLSGETTREMLATSDIEPDVVMESVAELGRS